MLKKLFALLVLLVSISVYAADIPLDAKMDYNQGIDFYKLGMYERAIQSFRAAIKTYPDYVDAYYNMGTVLEYLKQYAEALNAYKQVYLRSPNDYEVIYKLAYISSKLEDYDKVTQYTTLIPVSSSYYKQAQELASSVKTITELPQPSPINKPSKIAQYSGVYDGIQSPTGVTSDAFGNIYIAAFSDNSIIRITPDGKRQIFVKTELIKGPISLVSDSIGNLYLSNYSANNVLKITPQGVISVFIANVDKPYGLHIDGNMLFISCQGSNQVLRQRI